MKPILTEIFIGTRGRLPARNSSSRLFSSLTGRPETFASRAQIIALLSSQLLPPKPPPTKGWMMWTSPSVNPSAQATRSRAMNRVWVFIQRVSLPFEVYCARLPIVSIGACHWG